MQHLPPVAMLLGAQSMLKEAPLGGGNDRGSILALMTRATFYRLGKIYIVCSGKQRRNWKIKHGNYFKVGLLYRWCINMCLEAGAS